MKTKKATGKRLVYGVWGCVSRHIGDRLYGALHETPSEAINHAKELYKYKFGHLRWRRIGPRDSARVLAQWRAYNKKTGRIDVDHWVVVRKHDIVR